MDATYVKVRQAGRIVSTAVIIAIGVNQDGRREVLGISEAEFFWLEFLRKLTRRGLRGVKLVISDAHQGLKNAAARVLGATWQRCRVHTMRNLLAHAGRQGGAILMEQNDEWTVQRARYMPLETMTALRDTPLARLTAGQPRRRARCQRIALTPRQGIRSRIAFSPTWIRAAHRYRWRLSGDQFGLIAFTF